MTIEYEIDSDTGERRARSTASEQPASRQLSAVEIERLEVMDAESLRGLIIMVAGACWGYAMMDDTQKAEAARLKLYNMGMSASEVHKAVPALDKWFDRTLGKPKERIDVNHSGSIDYNIKLPATDRFIQSLLNPTTIEND